MNNLQEQEQPKEMKLQKVDVGVWVKASEELPEIYERIPMRGSNNVGFVVTGFFDGKVFWRLEDDKRNYPIDRKITEWLKPLKDRYILTEDELEKLKHLAYSKGYELGKKYGEIPF